MKNKSLLILLATSILVLGGCGGKKTPSSSESSGDTSETEETESTGGSETSGEEINHQSPFVSTIAEPSVTRAFDERFDEMADDFSGSTLNGQTTGSLNSSMLRVLVDSDDANEPKSPDAAIYKIGTGVHDIDKFDGIGFKMRMVGNKALKLSNLVLGLRGGDGYNVYPVKLDEALDPDGDALPALSEQFQDFIISPQLSIEDANTVYTNKDDGSPSELKLLDEILGLHLYALNEECSAILEIQEVYLVKAGEKTMVDVFDRAAVNKADDTCWWRDSTGFIVRKGVTLNNGQTYTAPVPNKAFENIVLTVMGDTTGASIKVGNNTVNWSSLKDSKNAAVSNAVNGGFYSLVINAQNSGLGTLDGGFVLSSAKELTVAEVFYTNLEVPQPVAEYPTFDANSLFMFDNFQREQSGFNGDYDAAIADAKTLAAGLSYQLSYNNGDKVSVDGSALVFDATNLGANDYINYKACNDNLVGDHDYMIIALKAEGGATLNDFRFNIGNGVTYINQMYSAEGLKVATLDQADYPYVRAGYTWLVIDLAVSKMARGAEPFIDYYYSGTGKLYVDFVAFANAEKDEYKDTLYVEKSYDADAGYDYAGYVYSPATSRYIKMVAETEGTIDSIRFEGIATQWFHDGNIKDAGGNVIAGTAGAGTYVIDLVASGIKAEGTEQGIHVHGDGSNGAISVKIYSVDQVPNYADIETVHEAQADLTGYAYVGGMDNFGASYLVLNIKSEDSGVDLRSLRLESGDVTAWVKDDAVISAEGASISKDTVVTSAGITLVIDLAASNLVGPAVHIHAGGFDGSAGSITLSATLQYKTNSYGHILVAVDR